MQRLIRRIGTLMLFTVVGLCLAALIAPAFLDRIYYRGPASAHFDGQRFFNPDGEDTLRLPGGGNRAAFILRYLIGNDGRPPWPDHVAVFPSRPAERVAGDRMVATWVGHASVLIQTQGLNILTDPVWSARAGPFNLLGPKRLAAPGIAFEDLPRIDAVLVSHSHYDHMDLPTLRRLWERDKPLIVTSLGNDAVMGLPARALDWGQRVTLKPGVAIAVTRNHHWGTRWGADRNRALWSSFTLVTPAGNVFFAGDTGAGDMKWPGEAAALGPVRLALIPVGAFRFEPGQMSLGAHIGPAQSVTVFERLGASYAIPIHWGTFRLSWEAYDTPPAMAALFMRCVGLDPARFARRRIGEAVEVPPYTRPVYAAQPDTAPCAAGSPQLTALK